MSRMNNFFCSLHLLVNFAEMCAEALLKFERLHLKDNSVNKTDNSDAFPNRSKSGTVRLLRTWSKAFGRGVDEKSGVYKAFDTYLKNKKDTTVKFVRFSHNRFNIFLMLG